jgi:hypothetical protein
VTQERTMTFKIASVMMGKNGLPPVEIAIDWVKGEGYRVSAINDEGLSDQKYFAKLSSAFAAAGRITQRLEKEGYR